MAISKKGSGSYSKEDLYHYQCVGCTKWWTIGDVLLHQAYCPHCGCFQNVVEEIENLVKEPEEQQLAIDYLEQVADSMDSMLNWVKPLVKDTAAADAIDKVQRNFERFIAGKTSHKRGEMNDKEEKGNEEV